MDLPRSRAAAPDLLAVDSSPSTNSELLERAARHEVPTFTALVTDDQVAGRGRLTREWITPPGSALAVSVLVPGTLGGWIPLAAGIAMTDAVRTVLGDRVTLKWPNDVLVGERKICGILAEVAPDGRVVVGAGLNTAMTEAQLPVPTATSLAVEGADPNAADEVLAAYLTGLRDALERPSAELRRRLRERCSTIGRRVRVELPGGDPLLGSALDVDADGRLEVEVPGRGVVAVAAGDVVHVRGVG